MRKLRCGKPKGLTQAYPARKWWHCGSNPELVLLTHLPLREGLRAGGLDGWMVKANLRMNAVFYRWKIV